MWATYVDSSWKTKKNHDIYDVNILGILPPIDLTSSAKGGTSPGKESRGAGELRVANDIDKFECWVEKQQNSIKSINIYLFALRLNRTIFSEIFLPSAAFHDYQLHVQHHLFFDKSSYLIF